MDDLHSMNDVVNKLRGVIEFRDKQIEQLEADVEDWQDKWHECVCGDLEVALGKIEQLETHELLLVKGRDVALNRIEQLEATIKEWESGALVRGWREIRADAQPQETTDV